MEKKKRGKTVARVIGGVCGVVLLVVLVWGVAHRGVVRALVANWTTKKKQIETTDTWAGGASFVGVPYAEVSPSDYVDIYVPSGVEKPPLLVIVHGGGFVFNDSQARQAQLMYRYFRDHGYACATVNYRLAQEAPYPAAVQDVKACVRFLKAHADTYGFDPDRVAIFGESAGGYLATMAAVTTDEEFTDLPYIGQDKETEPVSATVNVLLDYYGAVEFGTDKGYWKELHYPQWIINLANSWLKSDELGDYESVHSFFLRKHEYDMTKEEMASYAASDFAARDLPGNEKLSIWIAHGDADLTVPITVSDHFAAQTKALLGEDRVHYEVIKNAGHAGENMFYDEELEKIDQFMQAHM